MLSYFRRLKRRPKVDNEVENEETDNNKETTVNNVGPSPQIPSKKPENSKEVTMNHDIDFEFISRLEGSRITKGYVPDISGSESGVTVATGVDLGQWNREQLKDIGVPENLLNKLEPYLGLERYNAANKLEEKPLKLTKEEAKILDKRIKNHFSEELIEHYNNYSDVKFKNLEPQKQTVVCSVAFQYGIYLNDATPNFWGQVTNQEWNKALANLREFGDDYDTRRNKEADLLEKALV